MDEGLGAEGRRKQGSGDRCRDSHHFTLAVCYLFVGGSSDGGETVAATITNLRCSISWGRVI